MKLLITSVFFPPQNLIASQRPYVWARTWSRMGHDVTVLTVEKDDSAPDRLSNSFEGFEVVQVSAGAFINRIRRNRRGAPTVSKKTSGNSGWKASLISWLKRKGVMSSVRWPDAFDLILHQARKTIFREGFPVNYDVIVSSFGPHASLAMGYLSKLRNFKAIWVIDFRDLWVNNHVYPGLWPFVWLESFFERFYVNRADLIVTVSEALAIELRGRYPGKSVIVSPNGFDPEEIESWTKLPESFRNERFTIVYTGSLHPEQRNPEPLFVALSNLSPESRSRICIKFVGPIPEFLRQLVVRYQLVESVQLFGKRPREESLRLQREADVLLFLEKQHDESRDGILTGKLFEYLSTGRPIWAVGINERSTVGRLLRRFGAGQAFGCDIGAIEESLAAIVGPESRPVSTVETSGLLLDQFNRAKLAEDLLHSISNLKTQGL